MRTIPTPLQDQLEAGATTLCHVWILTRQDGQRSAFTDHDRPLSLEDLTATASSGWTAGAAEQVLGSSSGRSSLSGVLDDLSLSEADLEAGLLDGAGIDCWLVDWTDPRTVMRLWQARVRRVLRSGASFTAELEGPLGALERVVGRTYGRLCDAQLADERCRLDVADLPRPTCDKLYETCRNVFGNAVNFRGFAAIPGDDFLTLYPVAGDRHDGGPR